MSGLIAYRLADHLVRRWTIADDVAVALIRLAGWYCASFFATLIIANHYGPDLSPWTWFLVTMSHLFAWIVDIYRAQLFLFPSHRFSQDEETSSQSKTHFRGHSRKISVYIIDLSRTRLHSTLVVLCGVALASIVLLFHSEQSFRYRHLSEHDYMLDHVIAWDEFNPKAKVKIVLLVFSSWTERGFQQRQIFRESTLLLVPAASEKVSLVYRFVLGGPPGPLEHKNMGPKIQQESDAFHDILTVPSADTQDDFSHKLFRALQWADVYDFDYLLKTNDDVFVRLDTVSNELVKSHPLRWYWRGLVYW